MALTEVLDLRPSRCSPLPVFASVKRRLLLHPSLPGEAGSPTHTSFVSLITTSSPNTPQLLSLLQRF